MENDENIVVRVSVTVAGQIYGPPIYELTRDDPPGLGHCPIDLSRERVH